MGRTVSSEIINIPPFFTPTQLHPKYAATLAFMDSFLWLREHLGITHRRLLSEHQLGFVVYGVQLQYKDEVTYFEVDQLTTETHFRILGGGLQTEAVTVFRVGSKVSVEVKIVTVPLWISESSSHSAVASKIEPALLARFRPDELSTQRYVHPVPALLQKIGKEGELLLQGKISTLLTRHMCEFADQWYFGEIIGLATHAREALVFQHAADAPDTVVGLRKPIEHMDVMYVRPGYLLDTLEIETKVYRMKDRIVFVHAVAAQTGDAAPGCYVIEQFAVSV